MFRSKRSWLGILLALLGVALVRQVSPAVPAGEWGTFVYLLGVTMGLGGLALVASTIRSTLVRVIPCPECYLVNPAEATHCARCATPLCLQEEQGLSVPDGVPPAANPTECVPPAAVRNREGCRAPHCGAQLTKQP